MSTKIRLYFSKELKANLQSTLSIEQSHYIKNVMRLKPGDIISLFNPKNGEWDAKIVNHSKENTEFIVERLTKSENIKNNLWLAFSPIKKNNLDMLLQKVTELGVEKFIPILSERSTVREINTERAKKIIIEASEQSNRISIPEIRNLQSLKNFLNEFPKNGYLIFCDINSDKNSLKKILEKKNNTPLCILIGPEGDFSENERKMIIEQTQTFSISLAKNILKAETAALSAIAIVNYYLNRS